MNHGFLPISRKEMEERGWNQVDFVYVSGDAYVDHPSFGHAIITRLLEAHGFRVGIIAQPDWKDKESITEFGEPRLGFMVSAGNMDSMVNHYSVSKKRRQQDSYTPGGVMGKRPDYAAVVYGNLIRQTYKKTPIILGGIEASLRRLAHYDYWSNQLKRSILLDSGADLVSYGMGERSIIEIAEALDAGLDIKDITYIDGTVCKVKNLDSVYDAEILEPYEEMKKDKLLYAKSFYRQYCNTDPFSGKQGIIFEGAGRAVPQLKGIGIALHRGQITGLAAEGLTISRASSLSEEVFRVVGQIFADDGSGQLRIIQLAQCLHVHLRKTFRDEQAALIRQALCDRLRGGHNAGMVSRAEKFHRYRSFLPKGPSLGLVVRQRPRAVFCLFPPALPAISRKKHPL